jgi:hypothetical protein
MRKTGCTGFAPDTPLGSASAGLDLLRPGMKEGCSGENVLERER